MTIDDKIIDEKLQCDTNREKHQKYQHYHHLTMLNTNIL